MSTLLTALNKDAFWEEMADAIFRPSRWEQAVGEVEQIVQLAEPAAGARVLDLCCGPGRISLELVRRGFSVTGVDRTRLSG